MSNLFKLGDLLIADPSIIGDETFHRAAVFITAIHEDSPMGFIINKPFDFPLSDVLPEINSDKLPLYYGGPVDNDLLFVLHNSPALAESSQSVNQEIYFSGEIESVLLALKKGVINHDNCRFFLGYSGWTSGQLEEEIKQKNWLTYSLKTKNIFKLDTLNLWRNTMKYKGNSYQLWANAPDNPRHN